LYSVLPLKVILGTRFAAARSIIVDDSETTRRIVKTIIRSRRWTVCGEAEDGQSGVKQFRKLKPDVVLLDLAMPDINGIETAKLMSRADPKIPLILFTILRIDGIECAAKEAGKSKCARYVYFI
jgi:chemotaxis response regulator CheB